MEPPPDPIVQRHRLRMELRRVRERADLARREVTARLGWSESKLVRIEAGQVGVSRTDLKALLDVYGLKDPDAFADLARLAQQSRRHPWKEYREVLNAEFIIYLGYEGVASRLRSFQPEVIHGLLQTEDYARELIQAVAPADRPADTIALQVQARMKRQALLDQEDGPELWFILAEIAVRQPPSTSSRRHEVLHVQLHRLKELARRPRITIQILPTDYGTHRGSNGAFTLLEFPGSNGGVVYTEGGRPGAIIREDAEEVRDYSELFGQLSAAATDPDDLDRFLDGVRS